MANERVALMGLYEATGRNGKYLRGKLGRAMIWVFKNERKTKDTDPDWTVYVAADSREGQQPGQGQSAGSQPPYQQRQPGSGNSARPEPARYVEPVAAPVSEPAPWEQGSGGNDDIPF
jgi:hypothetical protein